MMYHPVNDPVIIHSQEEEAALGGEWSRSVLVWKPPAPPPSPAMEAETAPPSPAKRGSHGRFVK